MARAATGRLIEVPLELLDDGTNVRSAAKPDRLGRLRPMASDYGLRDSIRELGVLQPITVVPTGKRFEVLYGHRRTRAARAAGLATIPAIVEVEPDAKPIRQLVENQHRLPVNPMDIARTLRAYLDEHPGLTQRQLGAMLGRSDFWIAAKLALLELDEDDQEAVADGRLSATKAYEVHKDAARRPDRRRVFRLDVDHLDGEHARAASVVVALPSGGRGGAGKATISVVRGEEPSIELILEDNTAHGVMLTLSRDAARILGHRLMQAYQATAAVAS